MPSFESPFSGLKNDRKLDKDELVRAVRFLVAAEMEAVQMYTQLADSTDDKLAQKVLRDIADEERVHEGELLSLVNELDPGEKKFLADGKKEVDDKKAFSWAKSIKSS